MQTERKYHRQISRIRTRIIERPRKCIQGMIGNCQTVYLSQSPNGLNTSQYNQYPCYDGWKRQILFSVQAKRKYTANDKNKDHASQPQFLIGHFANRNVTRSGKNHYAQNCSHSQERYQICHTFPSRSYPLQFCFHALQLSDSSISFD